MSSSVKKRHARMVLDPLRTGPLLRAVKKAVRRGDVVVDIGTGTGVLAIAAAKAGAGHVWAVDCDADALDEAKRAAVKKRVSDKITFVEGLSFEIDFPDKADVILCETVGSFTFDENILAIVADAKDHFLKRGGKVIPEKLELWGALCGSIPKMEMPAEIARVNVKDFLTTPARLAAVDFRGKFSKSVHVKHSFRIMKSGVVKSVVVWLRVVWFGKELTDASPFGNPTHWLQGIMPIEKRKAKRGERLNFELVIRPNPEDPQTMTERLWRWGD